VLNSLMDITAAGGALGIPGLYVTGDPGAADKAAQAGLAVHPQMTALARSIPAAFRVCATPPIGSTTVTLWPWMIAA